VIEQKRLDEAAKKLFSALEKKHFKIVFAESCTAGLVTATLGRIVGISLYLAGSFVVYQNASKEKWLGISRELLDNPGPVSEDTAELMARNALERTPHADLALSVTGHLGPNAPVGLDGVVYFAVAIREKHRSKSFVVSTRRKEFECEQSDTSTSEVDCRIARQKQAVLTAIEWVTTIIAEDGDRDI